MCVASDGSSQRANCAASLKRKLFEEINEATGMAETIVDIDRKVLGEI
jgi:hypothetical protein